MSSPSTLTETLAMTRARELNRANERLLSERIALISQEVQQNLQKIKIDGQITVKFMKRLKISSGKSKEGVPPEANENKDIDVLISPPRKMTFAKMDHRQKRLEESSQRLIPPHSSFASEGNPIPLRTVHPWTITASRILSQTKISKIPRPTGRRRHSLESESDSSDEDDFSSLCKVKKPQIRQKLCKRSLRKA